MSERDTADKLRAQAEQVRDASNEQLHLRVSELTASLAACQRELAETRAEIEAAWFGIEHSFEMEPRALIAEESKTNGFKYPLAQAVHTIWKREPKVAAVLLRAEAAEAERDRYKAACESFGIRLAPGE